MASRITRSKAKAMIADGIIDAELKLVSPDPNHQATHPSPTTTETPTLNSQSRQPFILFLPVEMIQKICIAISDRTLGEDGCPLPCWDPAITADSLRQDKTALANFSATCRTIHEITLPFLYRHITSFQSPIQGAKMYDFTRSLIENPTLGPLVRSLNLRGINPWPRIAVDPSSLTDTQTELVTTLARRFTGHETVSDFLKMKESFMRSAPPAAWWSAHAFSTCLLLCLTPNITTISIVARDVWDSSFLAASKPNSRRLQPKVVFEKLTALMLETEKVELSCIAGLVAASPNLKTLTFYGAWRFKSNTPVMKFSNLTNLMLGDCKLGRHGIKHVLRYCTQLVTFSYEQVNCQHMMHLGLGRFMWQSPAWILECLEASANTLETIEIKFHAGYDETVCEISPEQVDGKLLQSVTGFPALKNLILSQAVIGRDSEEVLVDLIKDSPCLQRLEIHDIGLSFSIYDMDQLVTAASNSIFPSLRTIKLESTFPESDLEMEMVADIDDWYPDLALISGGQTEEALSSVGIELIINYEIPWHCISPPSNWSGYTGWSE